MTRETTPRTPRQARDYVAAPTGQTMASEHDIGQGAERLLKSTGSASEALEGNVIERVSEHAMDDDRMAMLAFMAEPITIKIGTSTDPNAEQIFEITVNGKTELFRRGETKTLPRYFVDRLMRIKETRYAYREVLNANGDKDIIYTPHTALKYDFAITDDRNPLGRSWERAVLAEHG